MAVFLAAVLTSFDSFVAALVLGRDLDRQNKLRLSLVFGLCDALASAMGILFAPTWLAGGRWEALLPLSVMVYALALAVCFRGRWLTANLRTPLIWTVPLAMSLDNLLQPGSRSSTVVAGALGSVVFSWLGFCLASRIPLRQSHRAQAAIRTAL